MGNTIEGLMALVEQTPEYKPGPNSNAEKLSTLKGSLKTISVNELFNLDLPEREMLLHPFLPSQGLIMLVAKRGVGKTHIALGIAYAIATGSTFLSWTAPTPKKVLYVDGEMPAILMKERLMMLATMFSSTPSSEYLQLLTPDLQDKPIPDLSRQEGREILEEYIKDFDIVILDNISCLFRSGHENESDSWQEAQEWALNLRRQGKSVMFVHHAGKNGLQRGTSKREDILDAVIILKHSDDYKSEEGARFEVHFDKARHFTGNDARSFQAQLQTDGSTWWWEISDAPQELELNEIAQMKTNGFTIKAICHRTNLTKAQVEYRLAKAKEKGLL
jgi:putative DNA primase/helicase